MNVQQTIKPDAEVAKTLELDRSPARRWFSRRNLIVAVLIVVVVGGLYLAFGGGGSSDSVSYVTDPAKRGALTETVTATGTVEPTNQVEVSSELSGTIREVLVDYNDAVSAGEELAVLDTDKLEAEVNHARASLAVKEAQRQEADATLAEAEQSLNRTRALTEKDIASQAAHEQAEATYERAMAGVAVAKANVEVANADLITAETNLQKATIRSPIDGVVLSRDVEPGQTVAASLQAPVLFTIAEDLGAMQLEVDIDEADVGSVAAGQQASFTVEAFRDRRFDAEVSAVRFAPETINNVVTYTGVLSLDNSDLLLRPGMTATADIVVKQVDDALLIPNAALRFAPPATAAESESESNGGGILSMILPRPPRGNSLARSETPAEDGTRAVYVLEDGAPKELRIVTGATDGSWTEVVSGPLEAGMPVITDSVAAK